MMPEEVGAPTEQFSLLRSLRHLTLFTPCRLAAAQ
jgi:hypothetical protein